MKLKPGKLRPMFSGVGPLQLNWILKARVLFRGHGGLKGIICNGKRKRHVRRDKAGAVIG